ncbi:MAG: hypothetical protein QXO07_01295 [Candidatus Aenigmatarchaeota archaeon]
MSLEKILKENPDVKITKSQFRSEEHFEYWFDKFRYTLPAQIIKEERGIYGTKIYYIYVPASKEIIIAEVPTQQSFVYTQDVIKETVQQIRQRTEELKSQGATHIEFTTPKYEIKDNAVHIHVDVIGYRFEKIPQQNLYSSLNQNNQNNFNYFDFLKNEAMQSYYYRNLTYDPDKYVREYIKERLGFVEYTIRIEKDLFKDKVPPIPYIKEIWDAGVSFGYVLTGLFGRGEKAIEIIERDVFEMKIPKTYNFGTRTEMKDYIPSTVINERKSIEFRPIDIFSETISFGVNLGIALSPIPISRVIGRIQTSLAISEAYKQGKLVAIETYASNRALNQIFLRDIESNIQATITKNIFEKSKDVRLGIIEGFAEIPKEAKYISYLRSKDFERLHTAYIVAEEGKKMIDFIHIPKKGTFDVRQTMQIYASELTGTRINNLVYGSRTDVLTNIHFLGKDVLAFKNPKPEPMKPFNVPSSLLYQPQTTATSQTLQQSQKVLVPIIREIQPTATTETASKATSLTIPLTQTKVKTQIKTEEMLDQKYYLPLVNTKILNEQKYKSIFASPYQLVNQQIANIQTKTPFNFENLRNFQTTIQQNFITTPPITTTTTLTNTQTTTTNINIPQIKTPEPSIRIPIRIPKISLPKIDNKIKKSIEKPREFKIFEEKIRFPSLYSLTFNIKTVNNKIAKEIIRPLKL